MIPSAEQLQSIAQMRQGNLAEIPFAVLLHALAVHRQTVVLEIERTPLSKEIILENGNPVDCRSNLMHETLSRFMAAQGLLGEEESQTFFNKSVAQGIPFGEYMTREGHISATGLFKVLQQNLAKKLLDGFSWRSGEFRIHSDVPAVDSPLKVNTPQLVVTGITKFALAEEVNGAVGPLVGRTLVLHPAPPFPLTELHVSKEQRQLIGFLKSGKRIDELAAETTVPFERIMRLLYSLAVIGIVVDQDELAALEPLAKPDAALKDSGSRDVVPEEIARQAVAHQEGSRPASSAPASTAEVEPAPSIPKAAVDQAAQERERNRVMETYLRYRSQDAFDLLGLEETATAEQMERQFLDFSQRFAPWKFESLGLSKLIEKAEDLFLAGGRAFGELMDVERRNALIQNRRTLRQQGPKKSARDRFAIKSELLDPAVQFRKGKALMNNQRYREAIQQLTFAADCDPQNSLYRCELAFCQYMANPEVEAQKAIAKLEETLRIDPKCGVAVFYCGQIQGDLEAFDVAEEKLRLAIKMMMPDRRPIEALKALQAHRKSKKKLRFL